MLPASGNTSAIKDTIATVQEPMADTTVNVKPAIVVRNSYAGPLGNRSALEDMMQQPRISKFYAHKRAFDHLFLEGGASITPLGRRSLTTALSNPGFAIHMAVGDWITPEHGWRAGATMGYSKLDDKEVKYAGLVADYIINLTALQATDYQIPRRLQFIGAMGASLYKTRYEGNDMQAWDLHLGLRAQYQLSPYTYIYAEPQARLYSRNMLQETLWERFRPAISLQAGMGFNLSDYAQANRQPYPTNNHWLNDTYFTALGGVSTIIDSHPRTWNKYIGAKAKGAIGKMFSPVWGLQLAAWSGANRQKNLPKTLYAGFGPEAVINLHNIFGGYKPKRKYFVNALAGFGYNHSWQNNGPSHYSFSAGGGLQANLRMANWLYFVVEPRIDVYNRDFFNSSQSFNHWDAIPSLLAGLTLRTGTDVRAYINRIRESSQPYVTDGHWLCDTYVTVLGGFNTIADRHPSSWSHYAGTKGKLALGKMFGPVWGLQLAMWTGANREPGKAKTKHVGFGPEVVINLHSALGGYKPERKFHINALAGLGYNHNWQNKAPSHNSLSVGAGLQANVRISKSVDFVIEPRVDFYNHKFFNSSQSIGPYDVVPSLLAGFTLRNGVNMRTLLRRNEDYTQSTWYDDMFAEWAASISGVTNSDFINHPNHYLRAGGYVGYGKWLSATSGLRLWMDMGTIRQNLTESCKTAGYGLDYIWNISNAFTGYRPDRTFSVIGSIGLTAILKEETSRVYMGVKGALKGLWMFNPLWGVYIEPQIRVFSNECMEKVGWYSNRDYIASVAMGLHVSMKGYQPGEHTVKSHTKPGRYLSLSLGRTTHLNNLSHAFDYGATLKVGYGYSFSAISGLRLGTEFTRSKVGSARYKMVSAMADYIIDMSAFTLGYNPNRKINSRFVAGAGLGADAYRSDWRMLPTVRFGSQLGVRLSPTIELFGEPSISYQINSRWSLRLDRTTIQGLVGINCRF